VFIIVALQFVELAIKIFTSGRGVSLNLLRTIRLVRVLRLVRTIRFVSELRTIVSCIAGSLKPLFWTGILLFMILYVLGVYVTQLVLLERIRMKDDHQQIPEPLAKYWGNLVLSMYSLFQSITGGIDWDQVARPLIEHIGAEIGVLYALYIMFTTFAILNVVAGVFIQHVIESAASEREMNTMRHVKHLFSHVDVDHSNQISWQEFEEQLDTRAVREFFKTIDVDIGNARDLFELLDTDDSGEVDAEEFMDGCLQIWTPAKGLDLRIIERDISQVKVLVEAMMRRCKPE